MIRAQSVLPVDVVFTPQWWHRNYGLTFREAFFFDPHTRVASERLMRKALYDRFGDLGLGESDAEDRPVVGPVHLAAGFMASAVVGCQIAFSDDGPPQVIPANLSDEQVMALRVPDPVNTAPMKQLVDMMGVLEREFGYLEGDINWGGVQNVALDLRGQQLYLDYFDNPALAHHLLSVVAQTELEMATYMRDRTGTTSLSTNRIVASVDPRINLHSSCSVTMVSNSTYEQFLLKYDQYLASHLKPYGIHYCGADMEHVLDGFTKIEAVEFFDVGWGSDAARCRQALPDAFFSLRLSPVRLKTATTQEICDDLNQLLNQAGPLDRAAVCCVNIDYGTPDENIREIFRVAEKRRSSA
jgi:hypothetical protein